MDQRLFPLFVVFAVAAADEANYTIPCGYYTCDTMYEFCDTGFVSPECLPCSDMCAHDRVYADPFAKETCQRVCPEYWRRSNANDNSDQSIDKHSYPDKRRCTSIIIMTISVLGTANVISLSVTVVVCLKRHRERHRRLEPRLLLSEQPLPDICREI